MKQRVSAFFLFVSLIVCFLAADGFCATGKRTLGGKRVRHISEDIYPSERVRAPSVDKYSPPGTKDESDCYNLIPDDEVPIAYEHDLVGSTWYEFQKYGSIGRMISVGGAAGYRHVSWMWTAGIYPGVQRRVYARTKVASWQATAQEVGLGTVNSGYSNQTHFNDGTSVVIFHRTGIGGNWCYLAVADCPAAAPLYTRKWDLPDDMPEGPSGEVGAWPKCEILYTIDSTVHDAGPLNYFHIIENEGNNVAGQEKLIGYLRCYIDPADVNNLKCQTPTTGGEVYNIPANTAFQDEVYSFDHFSSCDISAVVVTGRGIWGKRVAAPYMPPADYGTCDYLSDVAFIECMDNGDAWIMGWDWPPTIHKITNYGTGAYERAYHDLSACYDYDDSLHMVWVTCGFDPAQPGYYQPEVARLYHWSKKTGTSIIADKIQEGANPSAHNLNISKMSVSPKDPIYHGDSSYFFCIWTGVDSSDQNAAGDLGNQDLYGCGSFDGGNTWGKVLNITGTLTPGCEAGACLSEHWPSMATNMLGGDLHFKYICDRDAGAAIMDEGQWTENYVMYVRVFEWEVTAGPRGAYRIEEPRHWYHPPIKVLPNQTRTIRFKVFSIGNEELIYSVSSDNPCIQVSIPPTMLAPKDSIEISVLLDGTGACNGTFIAGNVILSTDEAGGTTENLRVHAVVSNDYYECPRDPETFDTLENDYLRMYVNANCQQWIHDVGWEVDTTHEVFFQGGTIVATTNRGDTLVGRFMGENDWNAGAQDKLYSEQCEPTWEPHFWILFTKEIYIEASHLSPPNHFKWFWWEIAKQVKFFKDTAPGDYQRIVIMYVKVQRRDPPGWWPDLTPFINYEDTYIGFAMDLDAPFDSSGGGEPFVGDENACNYPGWDPVNEILYVRGFGRAGEHPEYENYHAGIALAEVNGVPTTTPFAVCNVKNNRYLYPQSPWGWKDGELYSLATGGFGSPYIQDPDSIVDRSVVMTAHHIPAGTNPDAEAEFTLVEVLAPFGLAELQSLVATARNIVATERIHGIPAECGDVNGDGTLNTSDLIYLQDYLYGGPPPPCPQGRADVNGDGSVGLGDVTALQQYLYYGGSIDCPGIAGPPTVPMVFPPGYIDGDSDTLGVYLYWTNPQPYDLIYVYCQTDDVNLLDVLPGSQTSYSYVPDEPGVYCYFLKSEKGGMLSSYSDPACLSYAPGNFMGVPSAVTWEDSSLLEFHVLNCYTPGGYTPSSYAPTSYTPGSYVPSIPGDCDSGFFWDPIAGRCWQECAVDFFWDSDDQKCRQNCSGGYFWDDGDNLCREECMAGFFWDADDDLCRQQCVSGYDWHESLDQCCERTKGADEMEKATGWSFGNPAYDPGPIYLGWATNLQDQYYDNNTCTLPLIGAIVAVPGAQPVGGTRIYVKHWYRTADSNDRLFVTARERRPDATDVILTPSVDGLGFTGYYAGQGNNACGIGIPGFAIGEGWFAWSRFDIPTSLNGKTLSLKFALGSDASGNQGPGGSSTGWFLNKLMYIGTSMHRGDADCNGGVDVGDLVYLINYLYRSGPTPCTQGNFGSAADINCDGAVQIGDVVYLVNYLYRGGPPPPCPP